MAGSNSKAPIHRFPRKHSDSTALPLLRPVNDSHRSNKARPYVSGKQSANIPGKPLYVSSPMFRNEYTRPLITGIISGAGSIPLPAKLSTYSNSAYWRRSFHLTVPISCPKSRTTAMSTIQTPPFLLLAWQRSKPFYGIGVSCCSQTQNIHSETYPPPQQAAQEHRVCQECAIRAQKIQKTRFLLTRPSSQSKLTLEHPRQDFVETCFAANGQTSADCLSFATTEHQKKHIHHP